MSLVVLDFETRNENVISLIKKSNQDKNYITTYAEFVAAWNAEYPDNFISSDSTVKQWFKDAGIIKQNKHYIIPKIRETLNDNILRQYCETYCVIKHGYYLILFRTKTDGEALVAKAIEAHFKSELTILTGTKTVLVVFDEKSQYKEYEERLKLLKLKTHTIKHREIYNSMKSKKIKELENRIEQLEKHLEKLVELTQK